MSVTYFAKTNWRGQGKKIGIKKEDRRLHIYIIGKTGMGKSTLLFNMAIQDILKGEGVGIIDPHGDLAEMLVKHIPKERMKALIYFEPDKKPIALNVLDRVDERNHLVASGLISAFKKIWKDSWGVRMEYILRNSILALLDGERNYTLKDIPELLINYAFRKMVIREIQDQFVKSFWEREYPRYFSRLGAEAVTPILNKIGVLLSNPVVRKVVDGLKSEINFRKLIDERKIFIANLSKGKIGEDACLFFGTILLNNFYLASLSRQNVPKKERKDFFLFVDEFHNFIPENFTSALSECRKYGLCLTLAHQYIGQLDEKLRKAIFGNVGTIISFKIGLEDAEFLEKEFYPEFTKKDLIRLDKHRIYIKLAVNGRTTKPFSAITLSPSLGSEF